MKYFYAKSDEFTGRVEHYVCVEDDMPKSSVYAEKYVELYVRYTEYMRLECLKWDDNKSRGYKHTKDHVELSKEEYENAIFLEYI